MTSFPTLSIAPVHDETAPMAESTQAQSVVANQVTNFDTGWNLLRNKLLKTVKAHITFAVLFLDVKCNL